MPDLFEELKTYLPKYLSGTAQDNLFKELDQFPDNIDQRLFTTKLKGEKTVLQGDGLASVWVSHLPDTRISQARVMVLSNSCDIAPENARQVPPRLMYCPIISFKKFEGFVSQASESGTANYLADIRRQRISSMFFLPENAGMGEEGIALLDHINNCDFQNLDLAELTSTRLFTLSDYGFYLFLFKLSIHLTRIREAIARN